MTPRALVYGYQRFDPEDGRIVFLRNDGIHLQVQAMSSPTHCSNCTALKTVFVTAARSRTVRQAIKDYRLKFTGKPDDLLSTIKRSKWPDAGCCLVTATTRSEDALVRDTLFYSGAAGEVSALLVKWGGCQGWAWSGSEIQSMVTEKDRETLMRLTEEWPISPAGGLHLLKGSRHCQQYLTVWQRSRWRVTVLWGMTPCSLVNIYCRFGVASYLRIQF